LEPRPGFEPGTYGSADHRYVTGMESESIEELNRLKSDDLIKNDPALSFLVDMLLRDESFHHAVLRQVYTALIKNITLSEQEIWDAVWRDAVYHGTPGG